MNAKEYERYVEEVVKQLDEFSTAKIYRNKKFDGVRQPGKYEIDVAVEFLIGKALKFLLIIECKNWKRPVDRPIVQKLIQTREAIGAQKATLVSPVGFTQEAISVAKSEGVALWVIAENRWSEFSEFAVIAHLFVPLKQTTDNIEKYVKTIIKTMRIEIIEIIGYNSNNRNCFALVNELDYIIIKFIDGRFCKVSNNNLPYPPLFERIENPPFDSRSAVHDIFKAVLKHLLETNDNSLERNPLSRWMKKKEELFLKYNNSLKPIDIKRFLKAVIEDNKNEAVDIFNRLFFKKEEDSSESYEKRMEELLAMFQKKENGDRLECP